MAEVERAHDPSWGDVVIKEAGDPSGRARLAREAAVLGRARHPGVVELIRHDDDGDRATLVTRAAGSRTVADLADLSGDQVAAFGAALAQTLADLHRAGVSHGSVRPEHVVLSDLGQPVLCGLADAGLVDPPHGQSGGFDPAADVGALADVLASVLAPAEGLRRWSAGVAGLLRRADERSMEQLAAELATMAQPARPPLRRSAADTSADSPAIDLTETAPLPLRRRSTSPTQPLPRRRPSISSMHQLPRRRRSIRATGPPTAASSMTRWPRAGWTRPTSRTTRSGPTRPSVSPIHCRWVTPRPSTSVRAGPLLRSPTASAHDRCAAPLVGPSPVGAGGPGPAGRRGWGDHRGGAERVGLLPVRYRPHPGGRHRRGAGAEPAPQEGEGVDGAATTLVPAACPLSHDEAAVVGVPATCADRLMTAGNRVSVGDVGWVVGGDGDLAVAGDFDCDGWLEVASLTAQGQVAVFDRWAGGGQEPAGRVIQQIPAARTITSAARDRCHDLVVERTDLPSLTLVLGPGS